MLTSSPISLTRWKHECERVFADRLVDHKDKGWFDDALKKVLDDDPNTLPYP